MHHVLSFRRAIAAFAWLCASGNLAFADSPEPAKCKVSAVADNGMPKDIVKAGARWNFGPGSLWTHRGWQYAAYWDDARRVSVARRKLPAGVWSVVSLPGYQRTENLNRGKAGPKARGFGDGHEKVSMGISPDGIIHLAFDHHVSTLHYRTTKVGVANAPAAHPWTADLFGPVQDHLETESIVGVTYPKFTSDGMQLSLHLRLNGGSGSGDSHFMQYAKGQWITSDPSASKVIDKHWSGGNGTVNAYPHGMVSQDSRCHLTWCWRDTPNAATCHDLCYAYSDDQGKTWQNNRGKQIGETGSQFITADSPDVAAVEIAPGTSYVNGGSMTVDRTGRVHVLMRGENGQPAYFTRDPQSQNWTRTTSDIMGTLVAGHGDDLYVVSSDGLWRSSAKHFGKLEPLATGHDEWFQDCKMAVDQTRISHDGWLSVIGQTGKQITVIDYWLGPIPAKRTKLNSNQPTGHNQ